MKIFGKMLLVTLFSVLCMTVLLLMVLGFFSKMISLRIIDISNAGLLISTATILVTYAVTYFLQKTMNNSKITVVSSIVFALFLVLLSVIFHSANVSPMMVVKLIISIFCGTLLGAILGKRKHCKLRSAKKKPHYLLK